VKYDEPSIGRVITALEVRGNGSGRALMAEGMAGCGRYWPGRGVRISAQARLERFYKDCGFVRVGENYIEDTIPHVEMLRPAA
jgi:ElaA protein